MCIRDSYPLFVYKRMPGAFKHYSAPAVYVRTHGLHVICQVCGGEYHIKLYKRIVTAYNAVGKFARLCRKVGEYSLYLRFFGVLQHTYLTVSYTHLNEWYASGLNVDGIWGPKTAAACDNNLLKYKSPMIRTTYVTYIQQLLGVAGFALSLIHILSVKIFLLFSNTAANR